MVSTDTPVSLPSILLMIMLSFQSLLGLAFVPHIWSFRSLQIRTSLHFEKLAIEGFTVTWKTDDDPNNYGRKLVGPDYCYPVEYVETILKNAGRLYLSHPLLLKEEWAKDDIDPIMKRYMKSGTH